jgi:hypothetical protein
VPRKVAVEQLGGGREHQRSTLAEALEFGRRQARERESLCELELALERVEGVSVEPVDVFEQTRRSGQAFAVGWLAPGGSAAPPAETVQ